MPIKVIICCRVRLFAEGIKKLIEDFDEIKVLGIACDKEKLGEIPLVDPHIILSDFANCASIVNGPYKRNSEKILLINDSLGIQFSYTNLQDMVSKGLAGILQSNADAAILKKAIIALNAGEMWIDHKTINKILCHNQNERRNIKITRKETEILNYVCAGLSNKNIAQKLCVSEQTVKSHCNHLFKKFGVPNRIKLALKASNLSGGFLAKIEDD